MSSGIHPPVSGFNVAARICFSDKQSIKWKLFLKLLHGLVEKHFQFVCEIKSIPVNISGDYVPYIHTQQCVEDDFGKKRPPNDHLICLNYQMLFMDVFQVRGIRQVSDEKNMFSVNTCWGKNNICSNIEYIYIAAMHEIQ